MPDFFVGASRTRTLAGPLATSVARAGGRTETVTRKALPTTAVDGSETARTRGAGAAAAAVAKTRARSATRRMETSGEEGRFRRSYGDIATSCQACGSTRHDPHP